MGYKTSGVWRLLRIQGGINCGLNPSGSCAGREMWVDWECIQKVEMMIFVNVLNVTCEEKGILQNDLRISILSH